MERLTIRNSDGSVSQPTSTTVAAVFEKLAAYEDTGLEPEEITGFLKGNRYTPNGFENETLYGKPLRHWGELAAAEQEGRLVVLPCKVGDTVYKVWYAPCHNGETYPDGINCDGCYDECDIRKEITEFPAPNKDFIWNYFVSRRSAVYYLTRAEAEKAMGVSDDA